MGALETIANLKWYWVLLIVVVLLLIRYSLRNSKGVAGKQIAEIAESLAIAVGLVFLIIRPFIVQAFFIPSASMRMTLLEHDHILVNKFLYRFKEPARGDIVVFKAPADASPDMKEHDFIKRLIAKSGDTIEVRGGYVEIDGDEYRHSDLRDALSDQAPLDAYDLRVKIQKDGVLLNGRKKIAAKEMAASVGRPKAKVFFHPGVVILNGKSLVEPYTAEDPDSSYPLREVPKDHLFMMGDNRNNSSDSRIWGPLQRQRVLGKSMFIFWPIPRVRWTGGYDIEVGK